jgi:membrane protein
MPEPNILEPSGTEVATPAGGARRYRKPLKNLRWDDILYLVGCSFHEWIRHKAPRLGASLAFYTLLSLAPLLLVLVSIAGLALGRQAAETDIVERVKELVGAQGAEAIQGLLRASQNTAHGVIAAILGVLTLLFGATSVLIELRDALDTIWEVPTPELSALRTLISLMKERLFSFALVLAIGFLLVVSLVVSAWIAALGALSASILPASEAMLQILNLLVSFFIITGLFSAMYKFVPDVQLQWRDVVLGGAVTSALFTIGKLVLGLYLGRASFASTYGAAGSIVVLIVWVYYSSQIFFFGAELTKAFANRHGSQTGGYRGAMVINASELNSNSGSAPTIITPSVAAEQKSPRDLDESARL